MNFGSFFGSLLTFTVAFAGAGIMIALAMVAIRNILKQRGVNKEDKDL